MSRLVPYVGGKRLLARTILPRLPAHRLYCEPFAGSATILLAKPPSAVEILNDINGEIVNLFRMMQHHPGEFLRLWDLSLRSREEFERLKLIPPAALTEIHRAVRLFYLLRANYGGKIPDAGCHFAGGMGGHSRPFSLYRVDEMIYEIHRRLEGVTLERLPYGECLSRYDGPDSFFYLDPPYWGHERDYGAGIFGREDFLKLAGLLEGLQGLFLLSLNDTPEVRALFGGHRLLEASTTYTRGTRHGRAKPARELLIANYDLDGVNREAS